MYKVDEIIKVKITNITHYGFFFETDLKWKGLVHISEISDKYVYSIHDHFKVDDTCDVQVLEANKQLNQLKASYKKVNDTELFVKEFDSPKEFKILEKELPSMIENTLKKIK